MRLKVSLSIGFPASARHAIIDIEDCDGMSDDEKDTYFFERAEEWARDYLEIGYEEFK
jgi:hypothetical protein